MGAVERVGEPLELARALERRIDQHRATTFLGWHIGGERHPAVDRQRLGADVAVQMARERGGGARLKLAGNQPVPRPQPGAHQRGRARIDREPVRRIMGGNRIEIRREQRAHGRSKLGGAQAADPVAPFPGAGSLGPAKVGQSGARVGIDHPERGGLLAQMHDHPTKDRVLDDLGEISGVKRMAIIHGGQATVAASGGAERLPGRKRPGRQYDQAVTCAVRSMVGCHVARARHRHR